MSDQQQAIILDQSLTPEILKSKFNLALTKANNGLQLLHDEEVSLVYNEDNLASIKSFLDKCRAAKKIVETEHQIVKRPALIITQMMDASKREMDLEIESVIKKANDKYVKMCKDIEDRKAKQAAEKARVDSIQKGIDNNMLSFAQKIADCQTLTQLTAVERAINLEKTYVHKYQEFLPVAVEKFNSLTEKITQQKTNIKAIEKAKADLNKALATGDDEKAISLQEKVEDVQNKIDETKVSVQEEAVNIVTESRVEIAEEIYPDVKARRSTWKFEIVDIKETVKKMPMWVNLELNETKVGEYLKAKKEEGLSTDEFTFAGIRFFKQKSY